MDRKIDRSCSKTCMGGLPSGNVCRSSLQGASDNRCGYATSLMTALDAAFQVFRSNTLLFRRVTAFSGAMRTCQLTEINRLPFRSKAERDTSGRAPASVPGIPPSLGLAGVQA